MKRVAARRRAAARSVHLVLGWPSPASTSASSGAGAQPADHSAHHAAVAMVRIHPLTLQFDDDDMERELRDGARNSSYCVLILFCLLDIICRAGLPLINCMFDPAPDKSATIVYTCVAVTYTTVLVMLRRAHAAQPWHDAAKIQDLLWLVVWVTNVAAWWAMQHCGLARRLTPAEGQSAAVICTMWCFVMVIQHVIHIGWRARVTVLVMGSSIALTSVAWREEMLAALAFGEAVGYSMEHMARSSYLPRAKSLEDARIAKERSDYDLRMLAHSHARDGPAGGPSSKSRSDTDSLRELNLPPSESPPSAARTAQVPATAAPHPAPVPAVVAPLWTVAWIVNEAQARGRSIAASSSASSGIADRSHPLTSRAQATALG